ncbi:D-alanyl-D-alanine carboxypeptidase precursor [Actinomyces bovis]|uniref:D-alanyl-D-alanine carboxypeptidase n=1 Tax=Actinomyces bovis TaxID=1658 RepID=A0ABY1VLP9_9ACTO|nr:D-alanyl-D-alanine carboxypeptidase/D-alanyl-D-alanine-endopeptidase [Actinomyces bovis]SPT53021.1 D-alanyl-D-alanine carboxypeptidase precursor [Actinomyces bovis]VEG55282.1 D-alanyl-D-alanine carboxypeptidase precursor [Actinomyces israelii]
MRQRTVRALTAASVVVAVGFYGLADALDLVPGPLTAAGERLEAAPFPAFTPPAADPQPAAGVTDAPLPEADAVAALGRTLAADPKLSGAHAGLSVIDVSTGKELVNQSAATAMSPASSIKLLTAWAALSLMGGDHRLETKTTLSGTTVTLVGGGDVLLAEDQGDPTATAGHAGLGDLARATAEQLKAQGLTTVSVALDDTLFTGPDWSPEWEAARTVYVTKVHPIMVNISARPYGGYPADPGLQAGQTFAKQLAAAGITVQGETTRAASPANASQLASVSSAPLADVLSISLKKSENTMTEVEARLVALAKGEEPTFAGGMRAVLAQLKEQGFDLSSVTMKDACGLAKGNRVSPLLLAQMVARGAGGEGGTVGRSLVADLPVAGLEGTLHNRYLETGAAGVVRAKTGSLEEAMSFSGIVVTKSGRLLAFAVIIEGFKNEDFMTVRSAMDEDLVIPLAAL